jgi:putative chitinase
VWGRKPDWQGRNNEFSFAQAVQRKLLKFDLSIWQQLDRGQINDSQALQKFKQENDRQAREAIAQGVTEGITEQENPKVDLTPNYPNYQVLVGEFVGVKKNRLLFKILSAELKPGQGSTEKIFRAMTTNTPIGIEVGKVKNRNVVEDLSRRGFLGGLGAAALGIAGSQDNTANARVPTTGKKAPAARPLPVKQLKPLEQILVKVAQQVGLTGAELKQFLAQCAHETADFTTLREIGNANYFAKKYDKQYNPARAKILGNVKPGDGIRYKGRGFIQLTGRFNYKKAGEALGIPLEQQPELAEKPEVAAWIAVWFWRNRVKPNVSDFTNVPQATRPINPALKGLQNRQQHYNVYQGTSLPK